MDFIERFFGVSPDGGNGSTEVVVLAAIALVAVVLLRSIDPLRSMLGAKR
jgi:hypothetical protein